MSLEYGTCETCALFHQESEPPQCRANPPQVVVIGGRVKSVWPVVDWNDYCKLWTSAIRGGERKNYARQVNDSLKKQQE